MAGPKIRYWLRLFTAAILTVGFALFLLFLYFCDLQAKSFLHPVRTVPSGDSLQAGDIPFEDIELKTADGISLAAWYTPPQNGVTVLLAHGYGGNRPADLYAMFARHGYGVLAWDFRAHGASGGEFSTLGYKEQLDVEAALDYALTQPGVKHVVAWGGSMGAATVILTASRRVEIEAVIADSSYPALEDALALNIISDVMRPFVNRFYESHSGFGLDEVRPVDVIGRISPRPVLLIDSVNAAADAMDSPHRLYEAAENPKQLWVEGDAPHLAMYAIHPQEYETRVIEFLDGVFQK